MGGIEQFFSPGGFVEIANRLLNLLLEMVCVGQPAKFTYRWDSIVLSPAQLRFR
jgi:hypothetical protein